MAFYAYLTLFLVAIAVIINASPVDEKQPFNCPENEQYYKCALEVCYKNCKDLERPPPCPSISADCYKPSCECKQDFLRNENGLCVPEAKCSSES